MAPAFCLLHLGIFRVSRMLHPYTIYLPMGEPGDYFTQWTALLLTDVVSIRFQQDDTFNFFEICSYFGKRW